MNTPETFHRDTGPASRRMPRRLGPVVYLVGLALASAMVYQSTTAAFTGATSNGPSSFSAGTVQLTDDDAGVAMFDASDLVPGDVEQACIEVSYTGSSFDLDAVRLHAGVTDTGLAPHVDIVIEEGTGGDFADCTGFSADSTLFTGDLAALGSTHPAYASGIGAFTPTAVAPDRTYRVTATLGADTPNSAQGTTAGTTLTWEVHSS